MKAVEMVYQFKLEADRIDSKFSRGLKLPQIILFLNRGMNQLLKTRYGSNNNYQATFESIQKRIDEWQTLVVPHKTLDMQAVPNTNRVEGKIADLTGYLFLLRASFVASKNDCKDIPILNTQIVQSDDLNFNLDDPDFVSNFEWREVNYRLASDKIIAYTDSTFSISKADIDYLRYPKLIDIAGYEHFDGTASADVDCELPVFLHEEIVNEAVSLFKLRLGSPDAEASLIANQKEE